jgi:hypothetical protein
MADPQVYGPDGVLRTTVAYTTTLDAKFISGTIPDDTVDVQVSINGSGWSSDTSQVNWGDGNWTVPNPAAEPDGLALLSGDNLVRLRTIRNSGSVSAEASATIRLVSVSDVGAVAGVPTNIGVDQENSSVTLKAETTATEGFRGMNFWASVSPGGGATGYTRINVEGVSAGVVVQEVSSFASLDVTPDIVVDGEGDPVADPMFYRIIGRQEDGDEGVLQTDVDQIFEIPEEARELGLVMSLSTVREATVYKFEHNRAGTPSSTPSTVQVGEFASLLPNTPLYYVVTAVYWDENQNLEFESSYSEEVVGHPTAVTTALTSLDPVSRQDIVQQFVQAVFRSNPQIKVEAGSVLRDTVIDPFSSEAERLRFVLDFFHRARTPALLLQIDDPGGTGTSIPVQSSPYKQGLQAAFYLSSPTEVQNLINTAFEAYASNFGKPRLGGVAAAGEVTFFTTTRPKGTINIPLGTTVSGGGTQFTTTRASAISFASLASYYDPVSGRYRVTVPVKASVVGSSGNLGRGQVSTLVSPLKGSLSVVNAASMGGGDNAESNLDLTVRVRNALASVDSGTARGYLRIAAGVPGVIKANVVSAGDELMFRDLDENGVHRGGKVDIWVQGSNMATRTDSFAFSFEIGRDIQFEILGDPAEYRFRALDANLSEGSPILEVLADTDAGYGFRNASTGEEFDLAGVVITAYDTIQLDTDIPQPVVSLSDVLLGSYRRRAGNLFVFPRQPVDSVTDVAGTLSGTLPASAYLLSHPDAPLGTGRSALAGDYLQISGYTDDSGAQVPSGDTITVTDEEHVLVGGYEEFLENLGANYLTLVVKSEDGLTTYKGPDDPSGDPDYTVNLGTQTTALSITRTATGDIASGSTVLTSYDHDENFTVTYTTNLIVSLTQDALDENKHVTADVIAKNSIPIPLDIAATVVLIKGRSRSTVDKAVRTNLANFFSNLRLGDPARQSDLIRVLENTEGVSYVVVPLTKMTPSPGATIVREAVSTDTASESTLAVALSTNRTSVYLLNNGLEFATVDGGGGDGAFKAVFIDDVAMALLPGSSSLASLGATTNRAYIVGSGGASIEGISDDNTLEAAGYTTATAKVARRKELTANHILVSLAVGSSPESSEVTGTYITAEETTAKNVDPGAAQYVSAGTYSLTYDEDR